MKKRVWIAVLLLAAAAAVLCFVLLRPGTKTAGTQILLDGKALSDPVLSPDSKDLRVILTLDGKEIANLPFEEAHTVKVIQENGDENTLVLNLDRPLSAFGGKTAFEIAQEAFALHKSQQVGRYAVTTDGPYDIRRFGLAYSAVGPDKAHDGLFEHLGKLYDLEKTLK